MDFFRTTCSDYLDRCVGTQYLHCLDVIIINPLEEVHC